MPPPPRPSGEVGEDPPAQVGERAAPADAGASPCSRLPASPGSGGSRPGQREADRAGHLGRRQAAGRRAADHHRQRGAVQRGRLGDLGRRRRRPQLGGHDQQRVVGALQRRHGRVVEPRAAGRPRPGRVPGGRRRAPRPSRRRAAATARPGRTRASPGRRAGAGHRRAPAGPTGRRCLARPGQRRPSRPSQPRIRSRPPPSGSASTSSVRRPAPRRGHRQRTGEHARPGAAAPAEHRDDPAGTVGEQRAELPQRATLRPRAVPPRIRRRATRRAPRPGARTGQHQTLGGGAAGPAGTRRPDRRRRPRGAPGTSVVGPRPGRARRRPRCRRPPRSAAVRRAGRHRPSRPAAAGNQVGRERASRGLQQGGNSKGPAHLPTPGGDEAGQCQPLWITQNLWTTRFEDPRPDKRDERRGGTQRTDAKTTTPVGGRRGSPEVRLRGGRAEPTQRLRGVQPPRVGNTTGNRVSTSMPDMRGARRVAFAPTRTTRRWRSVTSVAVS